MTLLSYGKDISEDVTRPFLADLVQSLGVPELRKV